MLSTNLTKQMARNEKIDSLRGINSFFGLITGTLHLENRISRLFQACFVHSLSFRKAFFESLPPAKFSKPRDLNDWDCISQPQTSEDPNLHPDLLVYNQNVENPHTDKSSIFIESKIRATLTEQQLKNYRKNGVKNLIALTKYLPKIPKEKINDLVTAIRWQDIHSSLSAISHNTQQDRFICKHFIDYLEEAEMAYNQVLKAQDFEEIAHMFRNIAALTTPNGVGKIDYRFDCLSRCASLLSEIALELFNHCPHLMVSKKWSGYYNETDNDGNINNHILQYSIYKSSYDKKRFCWSFWFPQSSELPVQWCIFYVKNYEVEEEKSKAIELVAKKGTVAPDILIKSVVGAAEKWNVTL